LVQLHRHVTIYHRLKDKDVVELMKLHKELD
jgi:hypothetical protein